MDTFDNLAFPNPTNQPQIDGPDVQDEHNLPNMFLWKKDLQAYPNLRLISLENVRTGEYGRK